MRGSVRNGRVRGFSLIEVMVAVIVICVGLLGIAKMQALSLNNTTTARLRSLAALQAASLASAMHSNRLYWGNTPPASITMTQTAVASSDAALQTEATNDLGNLTFCVGNAGGAAQCTPLQLAGYDVANWVNDLNILLPNPTATVLCPPLAGTTPAACTIQIVWNEQGVSMTQQEANFNSANCTTLAQGLCFEQPTYTLYVEP
ncbi:MAG: type IV pilus modification protein PilV [Gammaproteobacteria bacterium]|nr:type IV pilus modification protein PilV [Gammaproteobacteria bacterium]